MFVSMMKHESIMPNNQSSLDESAVALMMTRY
jgi:hypothetical protein